MKAITLWPEWAFAIARLDKRIENRTWEPPRSLIGTGEQIAIHAGKSIGGRPTASAREDGLAGLVDMAHLAGWSIEPHSPAADGTVPVNVDSLGTLDKLYDVFYADSHRLGAPAIHCSSIVALARIEKVCRFQSGDPWYVGPLGWRLVEVHPLAVPVGGVRGGQRLWELPPDIEREAIRQSRAGWPLNVVTDSYSRRSSEAHGNP